MKNMINKTLLPLALLLSTAIVSAMNGDDSVIVMNTTIVDTSNPSGSSSNVPTNFPSPIPSVQPTGSASLDPSSSPTAYPTTGEPSFEPSRRPTTAQPTLAPPTKPPTAGPTKLPTSAPTKTPTVAPTKSPTEAPTNVPKLTDAPSTIQPTFTTEESLPPSNSPSGQPSFAQTQLSDEPSSIPSQPSGQPSSAQSQQPSVTSSSMPSSGLYTKTFAEDVAVTLFGVTEKFSSEIDVVEEVTLGFLIDALLILPDTVTLTIDDLELSQQTLGSRRRRLRRLQDDELQLDWKVMASASTLPEDESDLASLNFKALLQAVFLLHYPEYVAMLEKEIPALIQPDDSGSDVNNVKQGLELWAIMAIAACIAALLGGGLIIFYLVHIRPQREPEESTVPANDRDSYLDHEDYEFDDAQTEAEDTVYTTVTGKYPTQQPSDWSCVSGIQSYHGEYATDNDEFEMSIHDDRMGDDASYQF